MSIEPVVATERSRYAYVSKLRRLKLKPEEYTALLKQCWSEMVRVAKISALAGPSLETEEPTRRGRDGQLDLSYVGVATEKDIEAVRLTILDWRQG